MREIKFRAWDGEKMEYCGLARAGEYHEYMGHPLMQFTGLKDKNGVEIYENDVIEVFDTGRYQVVWNQEAACFETKLLNKVGLESFMFENFFDGFNPDRVMVIGNIHQHPELLT